jgi:cytochrome c-type biogenesis protein CcsB
LTQTFANLSNNAVYSATFVFVLAMLAHIAEWALARQVVSVPPVPGRTLVSAGGMEASGTIPDADGTPPLGTATGSRAEDDEERSDRFGRIGLSLTVLATLLLAAGVVSRGLAAHRVPWGSMYEFSITGSLTASLAYVFLVRRYAIRWLGLFVTGFLVLVLGIAVVLLYRPVEPLVPALHSYWLYIHVSAAAIAGGAYTVGALASVLYLLRSRLETKAAARPGVPRTGFLWRTPPAESIDRVAYRVHAFAFPLWTFAVLCGAIWAQYAWGRFWGWDPKEVWAFITWVAYAAYLHARATAGWQGRAAAYVALLGYATFLFNFVGINLFGSGLHSYAGM